MGQAIALVGHCNVDGPRLQRELSASFPKVRVTRVNSVEALEGAIGEGVDLLLVNREPVGFAEDGLTIIERVHEAHPETTVMLVSDYEDAQAAAVSAGAVAGFGKQMMGTMEMAEVVRKALEG